MHRNYSIFWYAVPVLFLTSCLDTSKGSRMIKVGHKAPNFMTSAVTSGSVDEKFTLDTMNGDYKVIFFYPADFTYVCPTELHAFQDKIDEFSQRNVSVAGVSTDSVESHQRWLQTPKKEGGVQGITYPLIADPSAKMTNDYGVLQDDEKVALRALFILDKQNVIQAAFVNNLPLGRNVDEVLRVIDAITFSEKHGKVCPASWKPGDAGMDTTIESVKKYFAQ